VGGKNASLGEMIQQLAPRGVSVPNGFGTSLCLPVLHPGIWVREVRALFSGPDVNNLRQRGKQARSLILHTPFLRNTDAIANAYQELCVRYGPIRM